MIKTEPVVISDVERHRVFQAKDSKGRWIGAMVNAFTIRYDAVTEEKIYRNYYLEAPGTVKYGFQPQATRVPQGKPVHKFGACQKKRLFSTAEERDEAIEEYFSGAESRALANRAA